MENTTNQRDSAFETEFEQMENIFVKNQALIYMSLAALGVVLNLGVLACLARVCRIQSERFFEGCAMPLSVMALSDLLSLISIIISLLTAVSYTMPSAAFNWLHSEEIETIKCKITMFLLHTMTGVSKWCWLFVSTLRFIAVYYPLWQRRQWRIGNRYVAVIFLISVAINSWLLKAVTSEASFCTTVPFLGTYETNRWLHAAEIVWSYLLPVFVTFILDVRVMFLNPPRLMANNTVQKSCSCNTNSKTVAACKWNDPATNSTVKIQDSGNCSCKRMLSNSTESAMKTSHRARYRSALCHWLAITTLNLILNTPDVLLRLIALFDITSLNGLLTHPSLAITARSLYFAQFVVNAIYLTCFVFHRNVRLNRGRILTITSIKSTELNTKLMGQTNAKANVAVKWLSMTDTETTTL